MLRRIPAEILVAQQLSKAHRVALGRGVFIHNTPLPRVLGLIRASQPAGRAGEPALWQVEQMIATSEPAIPSRAASSRFAFDASFEAARFHGLFQALEELFRWFQAGVALEQRLQDGPGFRRFSGLGHRLGFNQEGLRFLGV